MSEKSSAAPTFAISPPDFGLEGPGNPFSLQKKSGKSRCVQSGLYRHIVDLRRGATSTTRSTGTSPLVLT